MARRQPSVIPAHLKAKLEALDRPARPLEIGVREDPGDPRFALGRASAAGLDFLVLDLWRPTDDPDRSDVVPSEPALPPKMWLSRVVVRGAAGAGVERALGWARHTGVSAVILPLDVEDDASGLALARRLARREGPGPAVWVEVPWTRAGLAAWRRIAGLVDHDPEVSPCLRLVGRPPAVSVLEAWRREVPACLVLTAAPTSQAMQDALTALFQGRTKRALLDGVAPSDARTALEAAFGGVWSGVPPDAAMGIDGRDRLFDPVQPLRDHIGAAAYLDFEQVAPKYAAYQRAVARALVGRSEPARVAVLGAGRGPLVAASLAAADEVGVEVRVTAVEKNPQAAITLRQRTAKEWGDRVEVEERDMRALPAGLDYDLVVSELLGGFGDNELSPECLEGVGRLLAEGGRSLPHRSTSYLAPVECAFLWSAIRKRPGGLDAPLGVNLDRAEEIAPAAPCFTFHHPEPPGDDMSRAARLCFAAARDGVIHGFSGTFDAALDDAEIFGNHPGAPVSVAQGWSPLFFPLRQPARVKKGERIEVAVWRERDAHRVWYAWALLAPTPGPVQNARGEGAALAF